MELFKKLVGDIAKTVGESLEEVSNEAKKSFQEAREEVRKNIQEAKLNQFNYDDDDDDDDDNWDYPLTKLSDEDDDDSDNDSDDDMFGFKMSDITDDDSDDEDDDSDDKETVIIPTYKSGKTEIELPAPSADGTEIPESKEVKVKKPLKEHKSIKITPVFKNKAGKSFFLNEATIKASKSKD